MQLRAPRCRLANAPRKRGEAESEEGVGWGRSAPLSHEILNPPPPPPAAGGVLVHLDLALERMGTEDFTCSQSLRSRYPLHPQNSPVTTPHFCTGDTEAERLSKGDQAVIAGEWQGQSVCPESQARRPAQPRGFAASLRRNEADGAAADLRGQFVKAEPLGCSTAKRGPVSSPPGPPVPITSLWPLTPSLPLKTPLEIPRRQQGELGIDLAQGPHLPLVLSPAEH